MLQRIYELSCIHLQFVLQLFEWFVVGALESLLFLFEVTF